MIKSFEESDFTKDEYLYFDEVTITYYQNPDCTEDQNGDGQSITLSTRNNGCSRFISMKTDNWSVSGIDDLEKLLNDFKQRAGIKEDEND